MTNSTIIRRSQAISSLSDALQVRNGQLVQTPQLLEFIELSKNLQKQLDAGWKTIKEFMVNNDITETVKGEWGWIKLETTETIRTEQQLPPRFYKQVLDADKVRAHRTMHGFFPEGVVVVRSQRLGKVLTK